MQTGAETQCGPELPKRDHHEISFVGTKGNSYSLQPATCPDIRPTAAIYVVTCCKVRRFEIVCRETAPMWFDTSHSRFLWLAGTTRTRTFEHLPRVSTSLRRLASRPLTFWEGFGTNLARLPCFQICVSLPERAAKFRAYLSSRSSHPKELQYHINNSKSWP